MRNFVHLHNHSDYSLRHSISTIDKMLNRLEHIGQDTIALTDEGNLFAAVEFTQKCKEKNVRPIIGCELQINFTENSTSQRDSEKVLVFAKDSEGFENLKQLSTVGYVEHFYYYPRINFQELEENKQGLICILPQKGHRMGSFLERGQIDNALRIAGMYKDIFDDSLFLEIQNHGLVLESQINELVQKIASQLSLLIVAGNACYYTEQKDAKAHSIYVENEKNNKIILPNDQFYIKSREEMERNFTQYTDALDRTVEIAQQCKYILPEKTELELPHFTIPSQFKNQDDYLRHLTLEGIPTRYQQKNEFIHKRIMYELDCIINMGFSGYFLIILDIIHFCKKKDIPVGPGRGSVAGSIVAYVLGITNVDPIKYGLLFERFLNPERVSMPDIDTDFCVNRRQEVINYIRNKYGEENCGQIVTFSSLKSKGAIRDVGRSLGIPLLEVDTIAKLFNEDLRKDDTDDAERGSKTVEDFLVAEPKLREYYGLYPQLFQITDSLLGVKRHASIHAAGVVIGKEKLIQYTPLYKDNKTDGVATQYSMNYLEKVGLVKMDILGLTNITVVDNTEKLIQKDDPQFSLESIPFDDREVYEMLSEGKSEAVFQFESEGMQQALRSVCPNRIEELIALNALYRPGPIKFIEKYANVKNGREKIQYLHPDMEPILRETYGVIVYQEQVMHIAQKFANFSLGRADVLRSAMGKKKWKVMKEMESEFIQGVIQNGYTKDLARAIYELLIPFSEYGFNKSHAAAYAELAYRTAYLKRHYPLYYMVNLLDADHNKGDNLSKTFQLCRSLGIEILPPDINKSEYGFTIEDGKIRFGLSAIRSISDEVKKHIPIERKKNGKYSSFFDVFERLPDKSGLKTLIDAGIFTGVFDTFYDRRDQLIANTDNILDEAKKRIDAKKSQQLLLFIQDDVVKDVQSVLINDPVSEREVLEKEREYASTYLRYNPLDEYKIQWLENSTLNLSSFKESHSWDKRMQSYYLIAYTDTVYTRIILPRKNNRRKSNAQNSSQQDNHNGTIDGITLEEQNAEYHDKKKFSQEHMGTQNENNDVFSRQPKTKVYIGVLHDYLGSIPFSYFTDITEDIVIPERTAYGFYGKLSLYKGAYNFKVEKIMSIPDLVMQRKEDKESVAPLHDGQYSRLEFAVKSTIDSQVLQEIKGKMVEHFGNASVKLHIQENDAIISTIAFPVGFTVNANDVSLMTFLQNHKDIVKVEVFR